MVTLIGSTDKSTKMLQKTLILYPYIKNQVISYGKAARDTEDKEMGFDGNLQRKWYPHY